MVDHIEEGPRRLVRTPAADLWRHTLARIPTNFGRLVYLASLRNPNSGTYEHHGLAQIYGPEESDQTIRQSHMRIFSEWLCFGLEQQKEEVAEYMTCLEERLPLVIENWTRFSPYQSLVPADAREAERQLYLKDMGRVMEALRGEHGVVVSDPEA